MKVNNRVVKLTELKNTFIKKRYWTISALKDQLTLELSSAADYDVDIKGKHIEIYHKYFEYARKNLYLINLAQDVKYIPVFQIKKSDLSPELVYELEQLDDDKTLNEVVIGAIANLYESINFEYFHKSGILGKIRWEIVE